MKRFIMKTLKMFVKNSYDIRIIKVVIKINDKIEIIYNKSEDKYDITHVQIKIYPKTTMEKIIFIDSMACVYHNSLFIERSYNKNDKEILIIYQNNYV